MSCEILPMDPADKKIVTVDYSKWLGTATLASAIWLVPTGLTASNDSTTSTTAVNYFDSDDNNREDEYEVAVIATTAETPPRDKTQRFILQVEKRC